ncbi:hypothetical protein C1T17_14880 [Sphingobium sp. SCG-1]|uniref:hypothetical protein n=1 Tax=Sphingobium sp. SCG-1 TaxID=2072936 RepID=UPI000CD6BBD2|nr:hypothetical protein [Sphingobium sp. SCG-1]AUW59180.1 hypothetical protein C1T17_14880 [Sphingobium sp. SCG-1]
MFVVIGERDDPESFAPYFQQDYSLVLGHGAGRVLCRAGCDLAGCDTIARYTIESSTTSGIAAMGSGMGPGLSMVCGGKGESSQGEKLRKNVAAASAAFSQERRDRVAED